MGYEIKLTELQSLRSAAMASCSEWQQQLQALQMGFMGLGTAIGMQGRTADSICCYVGEVHGTIIRNLLQMMTEYVTKIAVYEQGYLGIDSRSDAHITQDVLEDKMTEFLSKQSEFEELSESIRSVLDEVSDICWISSPPSGAIESHFGEIQSQLSQLNEKVGTYENEHRADCDSIKEYLQTIRSFISGQSGKGQVIISTYTAGTIQQNPLHQRMDELHGSSSEYIGTNYEELQAASDRMQAEIDAEIAKAVEERKTQGIIGIVNGVIMAGGSIVGVGAIILSGGAATPVVAGLLSAGASTTILYGASDIYEGGDTYRLADAGDLTSIARNPIRDSVFNGNQMVYDTWGTIGSLAFLAGGMMQTAATISSQGTVQVENLTERANAVGKGAGGANNTNFKGTLKGKEIELPNVSTKQITYTKRNPVECSQLRNKFNAKIRGEFLKDFANKNANKLKGFGLSDADIVKLKDGLVPKGYQVHHKLPLDDGGTNDFNNLVLIKNDPYHKVITNYQNSLTKGLGAGESIKVDWPIPNGIYYNGK